LDFSRRIWISRSSRIASRQLGSIWTARTNIFSARSTRPTALFSRPRNR
jgi:hypothetical protein